MSFHPRGIGSQSLLSWGFPFGRVLLDFFLGAKLARSQRLPRPRNTPRTKVRLSATGRRQKVEGGGLTILIINKKRNLAGTNRGVSAAQKLTVSWRAFPGCRSARQPTEALRRVAEVFPCDRFR